MTVTDTHPESLDLEPFSEVENAADRAIEPILRELRERRNHTKVTHKNYQNGDERHER